MLSIEKVDQNEALGSRDFGTFNISWFQRTCDQSIFFTFTPSHTQQSWKGIQIRRWYEAE